MLDPWNLHSPVTFSYFLFYFLHLYWALLPNVDFFVGLLCFRGRRRGSLFIFFNHHLLLLLLLLQGFLENLSVYLFEEHCIVNWVIWWRVRAQTWLSNYLLLDLLFSNSFFDVTIIVQYVPWRFLWINILVLRIKISFESLNIIFLRKWRTTWLFKLWAWVIFLSILSFSFICWRFYVRVCKVYVMLRDRTRIMLWE